MILLDVVTQPVTISLGKGDTAMFTLAFLILVVCAIPFIISRR